MLATISVSNIGEIAGAIVLAALQAWANFQNWKLKKQADNQTEKVEAVAEHLDTVQKKRELPGLPVSVPPASTEEIRKL